MCFYTRVHNLPCFFFFIRSPLPSSALPPYTWAGARQRAQKVGARTEMPGCSLCMGNQARVGDKTTVVSTSTRNFPNRLGKGANVYLASAELAAVSAILGRLPNPDEYLKCVPDACLGVPVVAFVPFVRVSFRVCVFFFFFF